MASLAIFALVAAVFLSLRPEGAAGDSQFSGLQIQLATEVEELEDKFEELEDRVRQLQVDMGVGAAAEAARALRSGDDTDVQEMVGNRQEREGGVQSRAACLGGNDCCTAASPCFENEGDCDGDDQCQDGLLCVEDGCDVNVFWPSVASTGKHSFSSGDDCCMRPRPGGLEDYIEI